MKRILLIDDDPSIREILHPYISELGYELDYAPSGSAGLKQVAERLPDLIVLDITMPGMNGFDVCKAIRVEHPTVPILILSSRVAEIDKIVGLELGADDYVVKPFSVSELAARIRAHLRKIEACGSLQRDAERDSGSPLVFHDLVIDPLKRTVSRGGNPIVLTAKEFDVVLFFAERPGVPFSREQLLEELWGVSAKGYAENVTALIRRVRTKIEPDPANPYYLQTVFGFGYRFRGGDDEGTS